MREEGKKARAVFGARAAFYTTSACHADPEVLARVVALAGPQPSWAALDIATGTGHTALALAPHVRAVVATDITPEMLGEARALARARGVGNVRLCRADAHHLPFADRSLASSPPGVRRTTSPTSSGRCARCGACSRRAAGS
ncbi:MAG: class I SAM-dependent methyltransferase [Anaerolineae bacterium]|nr:class I SAM-dependent methyltransferase [Anaerolineae bacterium]